MDNQLDLLFQLLEKNAAIIMEIGVGGPHHALHIMVPHSFSDHHGNSMEYIDKELHGEVVQTAPLVTYSFFWNTTIIMHTLLMIKVCFGFRIPHHHF